MNEMTDAEINQAVAECCGWTRIESGIVGNRPIPFCAVALKGTPPEDGNKPEDEQRFEVVPNFASSRDAMAGALEKLSEEEWRRFIDLLWVEVGSPALKKADNLNEIVGDLFVMFKAFLLATPLQACRAFLKAKGKL